MRRYLKISLLLLILGPLFLLNVNALEADQNIDSIPQEEKLEDNNDVVLEDNNNSVEDIAQMIPNSFDVNYTEEDAIVLYDEEFGNYQVVIDINNQILTFLEENNIHLVDYGYSITINRLDQSNIFVYEVSFISSEEGLTYKKNINVNYSNDNNFDEEKNQLIEEAFNGVEEIEIENTYDFYTGEVIGEETSLFDFIEERLTGENYNYFFDIVDQEEYNFIQTYRGNTYLFMNDIFYKMFPTITRYITRLTVSDVITNSDITNEVREKLEEDLQVEIPQNNINVTEEGDIYSNDEEYLGNIEIKKEKKKEYPVTSGSNATIKVGDNYSLGVNCLMKKLIRIIIDGVEVESNNYSINNDTITISKNYLNGISKGNHSLVVRFSDGDAKTKFKLKKENRVEPQHEDYTPYYPSYTTYVVYNKTDNAQEIKIDKLEEKNEKEVKSVLSPSDVVKNNDKESNKKVEEKKEDNSRFSVNYIPIIIVICAFIFGAFGGYLYKKSLDD